MPIKESLVTKSYSIDTDGRTVWVNGALGLLGRFGVNGIDIHRGLVEQMDGKGVCLFCTAGETTLEDWRTFQLQMQKHYNIVVTDRYMPRRLRNLRLM